MKKFPGILIVLVLINVCLVYAINPGECNISLEINTQKEFYENESIDFRFKLSEKVEDYKIEYWVENSFGNIIKNKRNTTNLNKKSFSPKSSGINMFNIKARFVDKVCKNSIQNISGKY